MNKIVTALENDPDGPDAVYQHVGRQLRAHRVGRGMTQAQVAKLIGISPQQYQKYEDSQSKCSLTYLNLLAAHYGVSLTQFLPEDTVQKPMISEADLLARLVASFTQLRDPTEKLRIVQLIEAMQDVGRSR